jgi:hypothetical protein
MPQEPSRAPCAKSGWTRLREADGGTVFLDEWYLAIQVLAACAAGAAGDTLAAGTRRRDFQQSAPPISNCGKTERGAFADLLPNQ